MRAEIHSNAQAHAAACVLCSRNCGITITTEAGKFTKFKGDSVHPMTKGYMCRFSLKSL